MDAMVSSIWDVGGVRVNASLSQEVNQRNFPIDPETAIVWFGLKRRRFIAEWHLSATRNKQHCTLKGFFDVPVDNLRASPFLINFIETNILDYRNAVIVARNPSVVPRATSYAERLRLPLVVIHGEDRDESEQDGRNSPPPDSFPIEKRLISQCGIELLPMVVSKAKPLITLVGDVHSRIAIIVDDILDDVTPFNAAAQFLRERGAYKVIVVVTHGLLFGNSPQELEGSAIDEVIVTNTVPHGTQKLQCHKIRTVDISILVSEAIRRIYNGESMSYLFTNVPKDD